MLAYPYIEDLFRAILSQSSAIQGRFYISPFWLNELNDSNLRQLVKDSAGGAVAVKKYPLAIMLPPPVMGEYGERKIEEDWRLSVCFLKQAGVTSTGAIQGINERTNTSNHRIVEDWHDMKRCAVSFLRVLVSLVKSDFTLASIFLVSSKTRVAINPISTIGDDKVSGVRVDFTISITENCKEIEDYPADFASKIAIPTTDSHPKHSL